MKIEAFDGEARLFAKAAHKTEAQKARESANPYLTAIKTQVLREVQTSADHLTDRKIFYFADKSFLVFEVSYAAVEDGIDQRGEYRYLP